MTTLKEDLGPGREGAGAGQPAGEPGRSRAAHRWRTAVTGLTSLVRRHWLFSLALVAGAIPRLVAMIGFQPAVLFRLDAYDYLWGAVHVSPNPVNPSGYSLFLWLLRPFHSLVLVVALQHLMGLAIATMVYALLRRWGLPAWGATLAAVPVLVDPAQILIETFVMADLLAMTLTVAAFTFLLMRKSPSVWTVVAAGLLMGASVTVRPTTLPLVILVPVYLLIRRAGWRRAAASLVAGALPVVGYMTWFAAAHGSFNMSNSNGLFLWSRTMSFADCSVIKPPADLRALCPTAQPGGLSQPDSSKRPLPKRYLWNHSIWAWQGAPANSFVPDTAAFTQANNDRALRFAIKAITAQPLSYTGVIARESVRPFVKTNRLRFPTYQPRTSTMGKNLRPYAIGAVVAYTGSTQGVAGDLGYTLGTRLKPPFAGIIQEYQRIVFLPGPVFALIVLTGLGGLFLRRRRTLAAALLWTSALIVMVLPTAEHEYTYRYVIPVVPLVCVAAALAFRNPARAGLAGTAAAPGLGAVPVQGPPGTGGGQGSGHAASVGAGGGAPDASGAYSGGDAGGNGVSGQHGDGESR